MNSNHEARRERSVCKGFNKSIFLNVYFVLKEALLLVEKKNLR